MNPMCREGTPVEHYPHWGLYVKREDLCCPTGPHFSKTRGVYAHIAKRPEKVIGCLDTGHSQGGWATAQACAMLGKEAVVFYPVRKAEREKFGDGGDVKPQQQAVAELRGTLCPLQAGRSAVLYHGAKKRLAEYAQSTVKGEAYMMPNALKLPEMIEETVAEVLRTPLPPVQTVIVSASSGTIAAGVICGLTRLGYQGQIVVHQGYSRGAAAIRGYMSKMVMEYQEREGIRADLRPAACQVWRSDFDLIDEGYAYGDTAMGSLTPEWPCNEFYDLKAFRWWVQRQKDYPGDALLWNIG